MIYTGEKMKSEALLPEPMEDIGSFRINRKLYGDSNRAQLQDALRTLYEKIRNTKGNSTPLKELENYIREHPRGFDDQIINDAFEIFELPLEKEAFSQCRMDTLEEARNEIRTVVENMGTPNYEAVLRNVLKSRKTKYIVALKSEHFKSEENEEGIREFSFDFCERLIEELKKELYLQNWISNTSKLSMSQWFKK